MDGDIGEYFQRLYESLDLAVEVQFREVSLNNWTPEMNKCHDNVNHWVRHSAARRAVRGWIFWPPDETGKCRFFAHSMVEEDGVLIDITPIDSNVPRRCLRFLTHKGSETDFECMRTQYAEVLYPPIAFSEWQASQQPAANGDESDI
jgi:hypothetical protein